MACPSFWFANRFAKANMLRRKIKNKINNLFYITEISDLVLSATQKESISIKGFSIVNEAEVVVFLELSSFSVIHQMSAI